MSGGGGYYHHPMEKKNFHVFHLPCVHLYGREGGNGIRVLGGIRWGGWNEIGGVGWPEEEKKGPAPINTFDIVVDTAAVTHTSFVFPKKNRFNLKNRIDKMNKKKEN